MQPWLVDWDTGTALSLSLSLFVVASFTGLFYFFVFLALGFMNPMATIFLICFHTILRSSPM